MNTKNIIFNNFGLKLFSLFLAIGVWIMITGKARSTIEKYININVEFENVLKNANIFSNPEKVKIKLRGNANTVKNLSEKDFKVKIDLSNVRGGVRNYYTKDFLKTEKYKYIDSIHPIMIEVTVREISRKSVPIKIRFVKIENGKRKFYRQERIGEIGYSYKLNPDRVLVEAYKTDIRDINLISLSEDIILPKTDASEENKAIYNVKINKPNEVLRIIGRKDVELKIWFPNSLKTKNAKQKK